MGEGLLKSSLQKVGLAGENASRSCDDGVHQIVISDATCPQHGEQGRLHLILYVLADAGRANVVLSAAEGG